MVSNVSVLYRYKSRGELLKEVQEVISSGVTNYREIAKKIGVTPRIILRIANEENIQVSKNKRGRPKILRDENAIREAILNGVRSLEELCKLGNFSYSSRFRIFCREKKIELPSDLIPWRTWSEADELIDNGLSQGEIGKRTGVSKQRVEQYINESGQYENWVEKRKLNVDRSTKGEAFFHSLESNFLATVMTRTKELAEKEGFATQKAVEYIHSLRNKSERSLPFELLCEIFRRYDNASNEGRKLSLDELSEGLLKHYTHVWNILKRVKLEPMHGKRKKHINITGKYIEATKRAFELLLPGLDIDYFLGIPKSGLTNHRFLKIGQREEFELINIRVCRKNLTYRLVSQIYEAIDCETNQGKFTLDEIAELVGVNRKVVDVALENRNVYEPFLVECLKVVYNDSSVKTPYVTKKMKEKLEREG